MLLPLNISSSMRTDKNTFFLLISSLLVSLASPTRGDPAGLPEEKVLYLFGLFELSSCELAQNGRLELQAAQLAVQMINQLGIIPGYRLQLFYNDTMCDPGRAIHAFLDAVHNRPKFRFIFGPSDDEVAIEIARASQYWSMLQVSAGATSPSLSDRSAFPSFFRTVAPDQSHNHARAAFLKHHGWRHVGTLNENTESYALAMNELVRVFGTHHDITFVATGSIGESKIKDHLTLLKEKDVRIIIGAFSAQFARKVFCQAYRIQLYGPRYVWLIPGSFPSNWWLDQRDNSDCSNEELEEAIEGYLSVTVATGGASEVTPGFTAGISREDFVDLLGYPSISGTYSSEALAFDAVFAVAYTVRNSLPLIGASSLVRDKLIHTLSRLEFSGVSGPVSFVGGDRVGNSVFRQYVEKEFRVVAVYQAESHYLSFNCSRCLPVSWRGQRKIPVDRRKSLHGIESIDLQTFVGVTIVSCFGISLSLTLLCFNFRFRNHKFIKLSSPKLNNTTAIGCCLVYGSVIAFGVDSGLTQSQLHMHAICQIRIFLLSSGFSVAFGSLFLKTFRVHRIFRRASRGVIKSRLLRDNQLLAGVALLFCTDIAFQLIWYLTDPVDVQLRRLPALHSHIDLDTVYIRDAEVCSSQFMATIWLPVMYFYKGLMLLAGIFLTLETRNVKIPALNDSHAVGLSIYNVVIFSAIAFAINQLISEDQNLRYILTSSLCIVATTGTLCFLFVPKLIAATQQMGKDPILMGSGLKMESNTVRLATCDPREKYDRAEAQNRMYKQDLVHMEVEMARLTSLLAQPITPYIRPSDSVMSLLPEYFVDPDIIVKRQFAHLKVPRPDGRHVRFGHTFFRKPSIQKDEEKSDTADVPSTLLMETDQGNITLIVQNSSDEPPVPPSHSGKAKFRKAMVKYKFIAMSAKGSSTTPMDRPREDDENQSPATAQDQ